MSGAAGPILSIYHIAFLASAATFLGVGWFSLRIGDTLAGTLEKYIPDTGALVGFFLFSLPIAAALVVHGFVEGRHSYYRVEIEDGSGLCTQLYFLGYVVLYTY